MLQRVEERFRVGNQLLAPNTPPTQLVPVVPPVDPPVDPDPLPDPPAYPDDGPDWPRVRYETLYKSTDATLEETLNKVASLPYPSIVEFPADRIMTKKTWGADVGMGNACIFHPRIIGLQGAGRGTRAGNEANQTILGVTPFSSVAKSVCGSAFFTGGSQTTDWYMADICLSGSDQGKQTEKRNELGVDGVSPKIFTTFFAYNLRGKNIAYKRCLFCANYCNNGGPPGESFACQHYGGHGATMDDCEIDGRAMPWDTTRFPDGLSYGGSMTFGSGYGYQLRNVWSHHTNVPAHMVFYQAFESNTYNMRLGDPSDGDGYSQFGKYGGAMNHERVGNIHHYNMNIYQNRRVGDKGCHTNVSQGTYRPVFNGRQFSCDLDPQVWFHDPIWVDLWGNGQFYAQTWGPLYTQNPVDPNTARTSPYLVRNGRHVTAADRILKQVYYGVHSLVGSGQRAYDYATYPNS